MAKQNRVHYILVSFVNQTNVSAWANMSGGCYSCHRRLPGNVDKGETVTGPQGAGITAWTDKSALKFPRSVYVCAEIELLETNDPLPSPKFQW